MGYPKKVLNNLLFQQYNLLQENSKRVTNGSQWKTEPKYKSNYRRCNMSITNEQIAAMRASGQITDQEIAIVEGDLIVAKNVVTEARRIIGKVGDILVESTKRQVLKG